MSATLDRISPSRASRSGTIENLHVDCLRTLKGGLLHPVGREKQEKSLLCPSKYKFLLFSIFFLKENIGYFIITFFCSSPVDARRHLCHSGQLARNPTPPAASISH